MLRIFRTFSAFAVTASLLSFHAGAVDLTPKVEPGDSTQVVAKVYVTGELKTKGKDKKTNDVPLKVNGYLKYSEQLLDVNLEEGVCKAARYYHDATARIRIDEITLEPALSQQRALFVAEVNGETLSTFSPLGPLTRDELDLVNVQANSIILPLLLPRADIEKGESWSHDDHVIAKLVAIDTVNETDVKSTLSDVVDDVAKINIKGEVVGAIQGIATTIQLDGSYQFDLTRQTVVAATLNVEEDRQIGPAEPGFDIEAKVEVTIKASDAAPQLTESALAGLPLKADEATQLLTFESHPGKFAMMHDRNWRVMVDNAKLTVLRFIDDGDFIAQCNVSRLPKQSKNRLSLTDFQRDVQSTLGNNFGQFVDTAEFTTNEGLRVLRVVASGEASKLPVQWSYYHLNNQAGERMALVITMRSKLLEHYPDIEQRLVATFQFVDKPAAETADSNLDGQTK